MASESSRHDIALGLAQVVPALGLLITDPLPEVLRDSRSQMILLQIVSHGKAATVSEVATAMGVAVPTASTMVRKMVDKGLLERSHDPEDWRTVRLSLTPMGTELLREMTDRRAEVVERLLSGLPETELATLAEAVRILGGLLHA